MAGVSNSKWLEICNYTTFCILRITKEILLFVQREKNHANAADVIIISYSVVGTGLRCFGS